MFHNPLFPRLTLSVAALAIVPGTAVAQDSAAAVLKRASAAMGEPRSIRYAGDGTGWTFGQAWKPGMPWPKFDIQSMARTINFASGSAGGGNGLQRGGGGG